MVNIVSSSLPSPFTTPHFTSLLGLTPPLPPFFLSFQPHSPSRPLFPTSLNGMCVRSHARVGIIYIYVCVCSRHCYYYYLYSSSTVLIIRKENNKQTRTRNARPHTKKANLTVKKKKKRQDLPRDGRVRGRGWGWGGGWEVMVGGRGRGGVRGWDERERGAERKRQRETKRQREREGERDRERQRGSNRVRGRDRKRQRGRNREREREWKRGAVNLSVSVQHRPGAPRSRDVSKDQPSPPESAVRSLLTGTLQPSTGNTRSLAGPWTIPKAFKKSGATQKSNPAVGSSPLWFSRRWQSGRGRRTWRKRKKARHYCSHLPKNEDTLIRAVLGQWTEWDKLLFLNQRHLFVVMHAVMRWPQLPTQRPFVQEDETDTITNVQLRSWRQTAEHVQQIYPSQAGSKTTCAASGSPLSDYTHQTLWQQGGTGEDGHIHLADWTYCIAAMEKKKKNQTCSHVSQ